MWSTCSTSPGISSTRTGSGTIASIRTAPTARPPPTCTSTWSRIDDRGHPAVRSASELGPALEREPERRLLLETGGLMIGRPDSTVVRGARRSAETHGLRHELLAAAEVRRRFPALRPDDDMVAVWEPRAGILVP